MFRTIALAGFLLATALTFSGLVDDNTVLQDAAAQCDPALTDDGSGDECANSCQDAEKVHEVYRKVTGNEIYCTM